MKIVYAICRVQPEQQETFKQIADKMVVASQQDRGCIYYRYGKLDNQESTYVFIEHWENMADLELHLQQPHFVENFPLIEKILISPVEINIVDIDR